MTPDSFSDGGQFMDKKRAVDHALRMVADGADIIDVGGESTRPGADSVSVEEELRRVLPVIEGIRGKSDCLVSIDSMKPEVVAAALDAGAGLINDVTGLTNERMIKTAAEKEVPVVIMHMLGEPRTMQKNPHYENLIEDIAGFFQRQVDKATEAGISGEKIILDPGIGFGKSVQDNFTLIRNLSRFSEFGRPILVGPSRKSFIGFTLDIPEDQRLEGTSAAVTASILNGAKIVRVHDVKEMKRVAVIADHIRGEA